MRTQILKNNNLNQQVKELADLKAENSILKQKVETFAVLETENDNLNPKSPCLDLIQALVNSNKLYLTAYIRSNDMFGAWPQNTIALRAIQKEIAQAIGKEMGKLMIISNSAHIYEHNYEKAIEIVEKHKPSLECQQDPRGSFVIKIDNDKIKVIHMTPNGRALQEFSGETAIEIFHKIYPFISNTPHALDIGAELQKVEIALKQGLDYNQDNHLKFSAKGE